MFMTLEEFQASEYKHQSHCLLIGHPVQHSLSPEMHNAAAKYHGLDLRYIAVDVDYSRLNSVPPLFNAPKCLGANVTIPYKQQVMEFVDQTNDAARQIGAVNTIFEQDGVLWGANTDAHGFSVPLASYEERLLGERAVVFGTGGASKAVVYALEQIGMQQIVMVSRTPAQKEGRQWSDRVQIVDYNSWTAYAREAVLIVNTTPLGMEPNVRQAPIRASEKQVLADKICYDLVYRPRKTRFLTLASEVGADTIGGLQMLIHQGSRAFEYWTGCTFPLHKIKERLDHVL